MRSSIVTSLEQVPAAEWNALAGAAPPFLRHEFLLALERSGSVGAGTGWDSRHLLLHSPDGRLLGAMPLYLKSDSFGEFVFDWAWADAYRRAGLSYYPKLVSAVPYTPATGPRLLLSADAPAGARRAIVGAALGLAEEEEASSLHVLFPQREDCATLESAGFLARKDCQFHWSNRGYVDFDEFLASFTAEKRKKARRERRRVAEAGIRFRHYAGGELDRAGWRRLMPLYASSFWRRGREPYLNEGFFVEIGETLPEAVHVIVALRHGEPVATAICFRGGDTLYGRYWGADGDYHSLHFETCYYQGIEYCIRHGLQRFEPGTQGEHKISRGFVPTVTWSAHWLSHPQFSAAIGAYLGREREYIDRYVEAAAEHVPYRGESAAGFRAD